MEAKKILTADLLDLVFDGRNKDYGAYYLRRTYNRRIAKALAATGSITILILLGAALANALVPKGDHFKIDVVDLKSIKQPEKQPEVPKPKPLKPQVEMARITPPRIVEDDKATDAIKENDRLDSIKIGIANQEGIKTDIDAPAQTNDPGQIIENRRQDEDSLFIPIELQAQFPGGDVAWKKYLERNLNGEVAESNGAPAGSYTVWVQFVVDKEGNVSDVKALTNHGYGMEDEAVRVIKKGPQWKPATQNGRNVKAYRKQPITFLIQQEQ